MCARTGQPDPRDQALDRLLADALKPGASSAEACPDAERVAAYADQGLADGPGLPAVAGKGLIGNDERTRLETHFTGCARCQRMLAALGAALDAPVGEAVAVIPAPAAAPPTPRPAARPSPSPLRWLWWLSPAFGAAAAALLWMALRPAVPEPVQTAADYSRATQQESRSQSAPVAPPAAGEMPPAPAQRREEQPRARQLPEPTASDAQAKQEAQEVNEAVALAAPAEIATQPAPATPSAVAALPATPLAGGIAQGTTATEQAPSAPVAAPQAMTQTVTITEEMPLVNTRSTTLGGTLSNQTIAELPISGRNVAPLNLYSYSFSSPGGGVSWRLGAAGRIERSADHGRTWQSQLSGVANDLIAGSAASDDVAWVVGRGRVILRTLDGQRWERVAGPVGMTGEWAAVVAHDAIRATVVADDLRRYSTQDGGRTWTLQQ